MADWDGLDDDDRNEGQGAAQPAAVDDGGYEPVAGYVDLTQRQTPFKTANSQWAPAPLDGSVDLTPAPVTGLLGNFKALPFDGTSERWLYRLPNMGGPAYDDDDGPKPWIISRPFDLTGGSAYGYLQALRDPLNGPPPAGVGAGMTGPAAGDDGQTGPTLYPAAQSINRVSTSGANGEVEALRDQLLGNSTRPGTEGYRRDVYDDGFGNLTTGIGHKVVPADGLAPNQVVSAQQVERFYQSDAEKAFAAAHEQATEAGITDSKFIPHLAEVNFQLGSHWQRNFPNAWNAMKSGDYVTAAQEVAKGENGGPSLWYKQSRQRVLNFQAALGALLPSPPGS